MTWFADAAERAGMTFLQAWLAAWVAIEDVSADQLFDGKILTVGLIAAVLSILKSLAARQTGDKDNASLVG